MAGDIALSPSSAYFPTTGLLPSFSSSHIPLLTGMEALAAKSDSIAWGSTDGQNPAPPIPRAIAERSDLQSD
jgi:hypothetical protein